MEEKIDIREKISEGYVRAVVIVEVMGKPVEHVSKTLETVLEIMKNDKKITLLSHDIHPPKQVEESKDLFTSFMEVELLSKNLLELFDICYDYMPSSIEIVEPSSLKFNLSDVNSIVNDLASRLHKYDAIAKRITAENQILKNKLNELASGNPIIESSDIKTEIEPEENKE